MRRIWGLAVGPRIWPWPLAGQLGPYNLGSHSSLWPGERTHTYTHQRQRQEQQDATSTTWTMHSNKVQWKLDQQIMQRWEEWGRADEGHASLHMRACALIKSTHLHGRSWQQCKLLTFRSSACLRKRAGDAKTARERERRQYGRQACLHCISPSSITLNRKVIDYEARAERGRAEQRAVTPACMQTTLDMLIRPTRSNTQQTAKQHSWTPFHIWLKSRLKWKWSNSAMHRVTTFTWTWYVPQLPSIFFHVYSCIYMFLVLKWPTTKHWFGDLHVKTWYMTVM